MKQKKLWIARDKNGELYIYKNKPSIIKDSFIDKEVEQGYELHLNKNLYPDVSYEKSPMELLAVNHNIVDDY